jgi:hypothetical protein
MRQQQQQQLGARGEVLTHKLLALLVLLRLAKAQYSSSSKPQGQLLMPAQTAWH